MSLVYLCVELANRRAWYVQTDTVTGEFKRPIQIPKFDDEKAKPVSLEFAVDAQRQWGSYVKRFFNSDLFIVLEKNGEHLDQDRQAPSSGIDDRKPQFVVFTNNLGLFAVPGQTPEGPVWFSRAVDIPAFRSDELHTVIESVTGKTPAEAAQRAVDTWGQNILFADPTEKKIAIEQVQSRPAGYHIRPGDCSR